MIWFSLLHYRWKWSHIHRANQFTSVFRYWYILEYNYCQRNHKWRRSKRDLQIHSTLLCLWQLCNDRNFTLRKSITVFSELVTYIMQGAIDYLCIKNFPWKLKLKQCEIQFSRVNYSTCANHANKTAEAWWFMLTIDLFERAWRGMRMMLFAEWIDPYCNYFINGSYRNFLNILKKLERDSPLKLPSIDNFKVPTDQVLLYRRKSSCVFTFRVLWPWKWFFRGTTTLKNPSSTSIGW